MKCKEHSQLDATGMCVKCGNPKCENCIVDVGGRNHCKGCLKKMPEINEIPPVVINNSNASNSSASSEPNTELKAPPNSPLASEVGLGGWAIVICCLIVIGLMAFDAYYVL